MKLLTASDVTAFKRLDNKVKADSMALYLIGQRGKTFGMEAVGEKVFEKKSGSHTVSLIHRAYNFSGNNKGRYQPGSDFELEHDYKVTKTDITAFVRAYPDGVNGTDMTFEKFLLDRVEKKASSSGGKAAAGDTTAKIASTAASKPVPAKKADELVKIEPEVEEKGKLNISFILLLIFIVFFTVFMFYLLGKK